MVCVTVSCKPRSSEARASTDSPPQQTLAPVGEPSHANETSLRKLLDSKPLSLKAVDVNAFRSDVLEVAARNGKSPMSIVAPMIMEDEHDDRRLVLVLDAFSETDMHMDLAKHLPAGTPRRLVVGILVRRFEEAKDLKGLELLHDILPSGRDRQEVAAALATIKSSKADRSTGRWK